MMQYEFNALDQLTRHILCHDLLILPVPVLSAQLCEERKRIRRVFRKLNRDHSLSELLPAYVQHHYNCINITISLLHQSGNVYGALMHDNLCRVKEELEACFACYLPTAQC